MIARAVGGRRREVALPHQRNGQAKPRQRHFLLRLVQRHPLAVGGLVVLLVLHGAAVFAGVVPLRGPQAQSIDRMFVPPSPSYPLGTDENGRDVLSRLVFGARASLAVGLIAAALSVGVGTLVGGVAGYAGGLLDNVLMRITDSFMAVPLYFLWIAVLSVFGPSFQNILVVVGLTTWMPIARIVRGEVLRFGQREFVTAAEALGAWHPRILVRHIMPNVVPVITVAATFNVARAIMAEAALSFLGLGIQPPTPSWGNMLTNAQTYLLNAPWLATLPGVAIFVTVAAYSLVGDGLREVLDPTRK